MKTRTCTRLIPLTLLALVAYVPATYAQTATDNMVVSANVVSNCRVVAQPLNFGQYDKTAGNTAHADVNVTCTTGQKYDVGINLGSHAAGSIRQMANNGSMLAYELCTGAVCGSGGTPLNSTATGLVNQGTGNNSPQPYTVYGKIAGGQSVISGPYQDTLVVTVSYI